MSQNRKTAEVKYAMRMAITGQGKSRGLGKAFTLVELLIVSVILGVVITAVTSCLMAGVRTWDYARKYGSVESDAMIKLEAVHRDIANTYRLYSIPFCGGVRDVAFPGLVNVAGEDGETPRIGTIKYLYDARKKMVFRKSWTFPGSEPLDGEAERVLTGVSDMNFGYYTLPGKDGDVGTWKEEWNSITNFPGAVTMELAFDTDDKRPLRIKRTVIITAARIPLPEQKQQSNSGVAAKKSF